LIEPDLLIDAGPDLVSACADLGRSLASLKYLAVTHAHFDHFFPENLEIRGPRYRGDLTLDYLTVLAPSSCLGLLLRVGLTDEDLRIRRIPAVVGREVELGPYLIRPVRAEHAKEFGDAVNFLITCRGQKLLYAIDTGLYSEETLESLRGCHLDVLVMDATNGFRTTSKNHLNVDAFGRQLDRLRVHGVISSRTTLVASHFSHRGNWPPDELRNAFDSLDVLCAYDGMLLDAGASPAVGEAAKVQR
jgi:L-ascorbate metabolism protein UlaG (beta-lactamase superfamily)